IPAVGVYADGFIAPQSQCFADNRFCVGACYGYKVKHNSAVLFFKLNSPDKCIPLVVWIDDPLYAGGRELGIIIRESNFCCSVGGFADTNQYFHVLLILAVPGYRTGNLGYNERSRWIT